jgi:hypothetical protein
VISIEEVLAASGARTGLCLPARRRPDFLENAPACLSIERFWWRDDEDELHRGVAVTRQDNLFPRLGTLDEFGESAFSFADRDSH